MKRARVELIGLTSLFVVAALALFAAEGANSTRPAPKAGGVTSRPGPDGKEAVPKHKYIGVQACARLCHSTARNGQQLKRWQDQKHAHAFEVLKSDEAKAVAKRVGLAKPPHEAPECLRCHATGYSLPKEVLGPRFRVEDGVQCETCHGPGEDYDDKEAMKDREKSIAQGLVIGDKALCLSCHNATSPSWNPERFTDKDGKKVGFDFEAAWKTIAHRRPTEDAKDE